MVLYKSFLHYITLYYFEQWSKHREYAIGMFRGQIFTGYRVIRRFLPSSGTEYQVVDCLSKHAQHKLNGCQQRCTAYSDHQYLLPRLRLAIDIYEKP